MREYTVPLLSSESGSKNAIDLYHRKIADYLAKYRWYFPKGNVDEGPHKLDLQQGWDFFENHALGRYVDPAETNQHPDAPFEKALPGESTLKTYLFPITCKEKHLAAYGMGVLMYFASVRWLSCILLVAFLIQLPYYLYFRCEEYSDFQEGLSSALKGSAICTRQVWMPCPDCFEGDVPESNHFAEAESDPTLKFILVNDCNPSFQTTMFCLIACAFVFISFFVMQRYLANQEEELEEEKKSTAEYTIVISNPPIDARDPEEWKDFFSQVCEEAHVTFCTISLDNAELIRNLALKQELILQIDNLICPGMEMDEANLKELVDQIPPWPWWKKIFSTDAKALFRQVVKLNGVIEDLSRQEYDVNSVFVSFELQETLQKVLERLSVGSLIPVTQSSESLPPQRLFRGEHVLDVAKAPEPPTIRWLDHSIKWLAQSIQQFFTLILSLVLIYFGARLIAYSATKISGVYLGYTAPALLIKLFNEMTPMVVKKLVTLETHSYEESRESSLFFKICLFRWSNIAIILYIITPFTQTISPDGFLQIVYSLFLAEITTTPILELTDYMGIYLRHIAAPRAQDQRRLMKCFAGTQYGLYERYTNINKMVLLSLFYAALFPFGLLLGAISLTIIYWVDKYSVLRSWAQEPPVGKRLLDMSFAFNNLALVFYIVMTYLALAQFPYDDACEYNGNDSEEILNSYVGEYLIKNGKGDTYTVDMTMNDTVYSFCSQNLLDFSALSFPYEWMDRKQQFYTKVVGWAAMAFMALMIIRMLISIVRFLKSLRYSMYSKPQHMPGINPLSTLDQPVYVPHAKVDGYIHPFLFCELIDVPEERVGHNLPVNFLDNHNLISNVSYFEDESNSIGDTGVATTFSVVKYWPPAKDFSGSVLFNAIKGVH